MRKRLICLVVSVGMALSLTACGGEEEKKTNTSENIEDSAVKDDDSEENNDVEEGEDGDDGAEDGAVSSELQAILDEFEFTYEMNTKDMSETVFLDCISLGTPFYECESIQNVMADVWTGTEEYDMEEQELTLDKLLESEYIIYPFLENETSFDVYFENGSFVASGVVLEQDDENTILDEDGDVKLYKYSYAELAEPGNYIQYGYVPTGLTQFSGLTVDEYATGLEQMKVVEAAWGAPTSVWLNTGADSAHFAWVFENVMVEFNVSTMYSDTHRIAEVDVFWTDGAYWLENNILNKEPERENCFWYKK